MLLKDLPKGSIFQHEDVIAVKSFYETGAGAPICYRTDDGKMFGVGITVPLADLEVTELDLCDNILPVTQLPNAAQVLKGFLWKSMPKVDELITGSFKNGFSVDQPNILRLVMQMVNWMKTEMTTQADTSGALWADAANDLRDILGDTDPDNKLLSKILVYLSKSPLIVNSEPTSQE